MKKLVVYEKGSGSLTTVLNDKLQCIYYGEQYSETDERIMPLDKAIELINEVDEKRYIKKWKKITKKQWDYYLNVLPPERWENINKVDIFAMSETMTSDITLFCIEYKNKYYSAYRRLRNTNKEIVEEFLNQIKGEKDGNN